MTFYDLHTGTYRYNFVHTLNQQNRPDTLLLPEGPIYKVIAHTIPPVASKESTLHSGIHNIIPIDAPQGFLTIERPEGPYKIGRAHV